VVGGWRHFSTPDFGRLLLANAACLGASALVLGLACPLEFPRSILLIEAMIYLLLSSGVRIATRITFELAAQARRSDGRRTLIYGAGRAGVLLLREARNNPRFPHEICGFIDDQAHKGIVIQGVKILGRGDDLARIVKRHGIARILIAIPSATASQMREIIARCHQAQIGFRTMPPISEILLDRGLTKQIRDVAVEDLLGRGSVRLDDEKIRAKIEDRVVLITGAAGSIGSELCRQVARYRPAMLAGFDISETALFYLEREIAEGFPDLDFHAEIGSIQNPDRLRELFAAYRPSLVLHAAACKHVPLMEKHMFEAADNNIVGSWNLGRIAGEFAVEDFVMISSDKAVNPTNIMGASKRAAELLIRSLQNHGSRYVSVRFGNVLGSNGSVVPIFSRSPPAAPSPSRTPKCSAIS
jgi:FlaA1/EpsC-like NDP-sugar epimerase